MIQKGSELCEYCQFDEDCKCLCHKKNYINSKHFFMSEDATSKTPFLKRFIINHFRGERHATV